MRVSVNIKTELSVVFEEGGNERRRAKHFCLLPRAAANGWVGTKGPSSSSLPPLLSFVTESCALTFMAMALVSFALPQKGPDDGGDDEEEEEEQQH